jgi:hypothetical protein
MKAERARHPSLLDAGLSAVLPGLGQLRQGDGARGVALALPCLGLWGAVMLSLFGPAPVRSVITAALLALLYPLLWLPAVLDAWNRGGGSAAPAISPDEAWYVVLSLLAVGPMALPLLWQGSVFSLRGKIVWTVVVVGIALAALVFILLLGPWLEALLVEMLELLAA